MISSLTSSQGDAMTQDSEAIRKKEANLTAFFHLFKKIQHKQSLEKTNQLGETIHNTYHKHSANIPNI